MDVDMPIMDGISTTIKIRNIEKEKNINNIKIIGTTGYSD
jgi:CheY-like chemotaxis protein